MDIQKITFGHLLNGQEVSLFTLKNAAGMTAKISDYGGILVALTAPDRNGDFADVVLGCVTLEGYLKGTPYFGAIVGRYANRIAGGSFTLDDKTYTLAKNNGQNALHGGLVGFDKKIWAATTLDGNEPSLKLSYLSVDGEEGYPGNLSIEVTYTLQQNNALRIDYQAVTDKSTVLNLTNHSYFNLGEVSNVMNHEATIYADKFLSVDANIIPTGELKSVIETPFDFTESHPIGERIDDKNDEQIKLGSGYDHCYVLSETGSDLKLAARIYEPKSGRLMKVLTTEPAMQLYTANHLKGNILGKNGATYGRRSAFCVETQHFPDSPNQPSFPTTVLRPDEIFESITIYQFSAE